MRSKVSKWLKRHGEIFLKEVGIKSGQIVLDFGCGEGHYTIPAARVVGREGTVYAVDKDKAVLDELVKAAKKEGLENIEPIKTSGELKIGLEDESVDVVLLYDILHYMEQRKRIFNEAHRVLKTEGLLSVYPKHHKLDEPLWNLADIELEDIIKEIEIANFYFEGKVLKTLIHDDNYTKGYILSFFPVK